MSQKSFDGPVMRAVREIEGNGHLRSRLRRADSARDAWGLAESSKFDSELRNSCPWIAREQAIPDECLILLAQRNVGLQGQESRHTPLATLLGGRIEEDRAMSGLRFQRLMSAKVGDDRLRQMRRALSLLKQPVHPIAVVKAYLDLHNEVGARRFANEYFQGASAPAAESSTIEATPAQGVTP